VDYVNFCKQKSGPMRPATKEIIWLLLIGGEALEEPKM
jgi:hypothetical protein